ncbi:MAG: HDOD domain-containing protein, partial [Bacteroidota bacterium]
MPQTLTEALEFMRHPEHLEIAPVTAMVQRDPVVVARLLNIVNSAYYGLRHQITSADRAVVMLGPVAVAGIVVGMQMLKLRELIDGPAGACFNRLIRHSVATAF